MTASGFDLFRKDAEEQAIWIDSATDLEIAHSRLAELAANSPGEYFIFDQAKGRIVTNMVGRGSA
jgi:hypothetical protein